MRDLLIIGLLLLSASCFSSPLILAEKFITVSDATKVKGATAKEIKLVADLLTDDMRYQHPKYQVDVSKQAFIAGLKHWMGSAEQLNSTIKNSIVGDNAVVISYISKSKRAGKIEIDETPLMRLFEFKDGKISLVREYW